MYQTIFCVSSSGHMVAPPSSVMFSSVSVAEASSASGSMTIMRFVKEPARMTLPPSRSAMVHVVSCVMVTVPQIRMTGFLLSASSDFARSKVLTALSSVVPSFASSPSVPSR